MNIATRWQELSRVLMLMNRHCGTHEQRDFTPEEVDALSKHFGAVQDEILKLNSYLNSKGLFYA